MKSRPTPANLYTTRRIGLQHWQDPESKTLFSQGKYPTKLTNRDLPGWFLSGTYYGTRGYLRTNSIKGLWYRPCYHTNHMLKDDFLYISYQHPISSCPLLDTYLSSPDSKLYDEAIFGGIIPRFLRSVEQCSLYDCTSIPPTKSCSTFGGVLMVILNSGTLLFLVLLAFAAGFLVDAAIGVRAHLHDKED